jgi:Tfp pilus assembly protein PilF
VEEQLFLRQRALSLWNEGQRLQLDGDIARAVELYDQSIAVFPTAEAHTCRAWALSFQNRLDEAIAECKRAIAVDPSFGNPYNDIGSYLIAMGKSDEAIEWLERAKRAPRYKPRHFPYVNLGRLFAEQGMVARAIAELEVAQRLCPDEPAILATLAALRQRIN